MSPPPPLIRGGGRAKKFFSPSLYWILMKTGGNISGTEEKEMRTNMEHYLLALTAPAAVLFSLGKVLIQNWIFF